MRIRLETSKMVLGEYEEEEIKNLIKELEVAQGIFGDSALRLVYLIRAEHTLQKIITNIVESHP